MKRFLALFALFFLINIEFCSAQPVQAVGRGISEQIAVHDAIRNAIEQKFGVSVHSKTLTQNFALIADEIALDSSAFVSSWKILSCRVENGIFIVQAEIDLDDAKLSAKLRQIDKKALVDFNLANPRVAVLVFDSNRRRYPQIENQIISAIKNQGFTRTIDLSQVNRAVFQRISSAIGDFQLRKTLINDFHADFLVIAEISRLDDDFSISSRLIALNTGEIVFAGTSNGGGAFISRSDALKLAAKRAANDISAAALKSAAKIEQHLTLFITPHTFQRLGGSLTALRQIFINFPGVNDVFTRNFNSSLEFDINFDGSASDFALILESNNIPILELKMAYIKI